MSKQKISAKQVLNDISAGMSDAELMEKYGITPKGLESLFGKLTQAGLLKEASLRKRSSSSAQEAAAPAGHASIPRAEPTIPMEQKSSDSLATIAEDVKNGVHDGEIMRRYELSPGKLRELKERLVQEGYLEPDLVAQEEIKKTQTCRVCSREIPQAAGKCPHCGEWLETDASGASLNSPVPAEEFHEVPSAEGDFEDEKECAWESRENYGTTKAYIKTATECLMRPTAFFDNLPLEGKYLDPILFAVMSGVMSVVLAYMWTSLFSGGLLGLVALLFGMAFVFLISLITLPFVLLIWSALLHGSLCLVRGANEGFQTTFRVASYSSVTTLFNALPIPYLGSIASLWGLVLTVIGIRETHKTTTGKAAGAVFISFGVVLAVLAIFFSSILMAALSGTKTARTSGIPEEVCTAVKEFVHRVDACASMESSEAEAQLQQAAKELEQALRPYQHNKDVQQLGGKAYAYQVGIFFQNQMGVGSRLETSQMRGGLQQQRDELLACSAILKRR
ncbi:MAG: YIP1 family protein [Desulfomonile tiedjei]|uniref:YIP1 family protein n=1 Tax=Desulfomonile tiedjei TaxID=2358 RepID=A0A9D6V8D5_9BACT|nr:YIP1 family protein [Desulfomonile tiedjei]